MRKRRLEGCESGGAIIGISKAKAVVYGAGKDDLVYLLIFVGLECSADDGVKLSLHFGIRTMRVNIVTLDSWSSFLMK